MDKLQKDLLALALEECFINLEDNSEVYHEDVVRIGRFPSAATPTVTQGQNFKHMQHNDSSMKKALWRKFWVSHQRFFKYLCFAAKVKFAVKLVREALETGKCSAICLQPNGELRTLDQLEEGGLDSPGESTSSSRKRKGVNLGRKRCKVSDEEYIHTVSDSEETDDTESDEGSSSGLDTQERDYNPFENGSDSDTPWACRESRTD
ncbi:protein strawberry notch [Caerostris darwini]|uniref:Protein strawberry notch n=1 Tax=Caerostris darwini TaxID=1538125 RepID=A0AAV4X7R2_9ARAC|nr:protein strawberry notch [Caerostris darwini]